MISVTYVVEEVFQLKDFKCIFLFLFHVFARSFLRGELEVTPRSYCGENVCRPAAVQLVSKTL